VTTPDDAGIQSQIERTLAADPTLSKLDVSTLVENGKVTIVGSVRSTDLKQRVEKVLRAVKGVISVDNQLVVTEATP
jgi:osmotically-inducible protein OsmY